MTDSTGAAPTPATLSSPMETLFALTPDSGVDPVGAALHATWVAMVENGVPFETNDSVVDENPDFADYYGADFFPHRVADPSAGLVGGLSDGWWTAYSTALVCDALANMVMTVRPMLNLAVIAADLTAMSPQLAATAHAEYLGQYRTMFDSVIAPVLAAPDALQAYTNLLTSPAWIAARQAAILSGQWQDADWELFNHTLKLRVLGATDDQVSAALLRLADGGLTVPSDVSAATWLNYQPYLRNPPLQWSDLSTDGQDGLHAPSYFWRDFPGGNTSSATPDGLALEFVKLVKYYVAPSGSCFTPSTRVLLPDGSDVALSHVRPGDEVWTPDGSRPVRVAAEVARRGRTLSHFAGARFAFSDSHPFVDGESPTASLAVHPARAVAFTPGLDATGVRSLTASTQVVAVGRDGTSRPIDAPGLHDLAVAEAASASAGTSDDLLIDLILEPGERGFPAYAVGDGGNTHFYLVRSEVLRFERHPFGTIAGIGLLVGSLDSAMAALAPLTPNDAADVTAAMRRVASPLIVDGLRRLAADEVDERVDQADHLAHEELDAILGAFHGGTDATFDWRLGTLHESLAATLLIPFDHVIRAAPYAMSLAVGADDAAMASVAIHDVTGEGHFPLDGQWTLETEVNGIAAGSVPVMDGDGATHHRRIGWSLPVSVGAAGASDASTAAAPIVIEVRLTAAEDLCVLTGRGVLQPAVAGGYHHCAVPLRATSGGRVDAVVRLDAMTVGAGASISDPSAAEFDDGRRRTYARRLGVALAASFSELFPAALQSVRSRR